MAKLFVDVIICTIIVTSVFFLYFLNILLNSFLLHQENQTDYDWIKIGLTNVLGYSTLLLPGYLVFKYTRRINYLSKNGTGLFSRLIKICYGDDDSNLPVFMAPSAKSSKRSVLEDTLLLMFYFCGLQLSYLSWGLLQEKVMTQVYRNAANEVGHFKDSQFLVFVNRILSFIISGIILICKQQPRHKCPMYKYVFCSFSNIMSSWCQYEALKYVSFPHQILAKAAKVIPVMVMGKIVSKAQYEFYEYITSIILSIGMLFFMIDVGNDRAKSTATTFCGFLLLCFYIIFDSFTSNWQGQLFRKYSMKPVQMMCFVNLFSCLFTATSLLQQDSFWTSGSFMIKYPQFFIDCIFLSVCSAIGQLFIYSVLSVYGPVIFAIITTIRQGFSILLSCLVYHHNVNALGMFGFGLVFFSILLRIYCSQRLKMIRNAQSEGSKDQRLS